LRVKLTSDVGGLVHLVDQRGHVAR